MNLSKNELGTNRRVELKLKEILSQNYLENLQKI